MFRKLIIIAVSLCTVFTFAACGTQITVDGSEQGGNVLTQGNLPSAEEIAAQAVEAMAEVKSCRFDMKMDMDMSGESEGESFDTTMMMEATSDLDIEHTEMSMDFVISMDIPDEGDMAMGMAMYLVGDGMYMMMEMPEMDPMWMKMELPEGTWGEMNQLQPQVDMLSMAELEVLGSETINGTDCYVLRIVADEELIWELVMQQMNTVGGEIPEIDEEFMKDIWRDISMKQWIAKDTYLLVRTEMDLVMEMSSDAMGLPEVEGEFAIDLSMYMDMRIYDYNQPVSIELPPEAEDAVSFMS